MRRLVLLVVLLVGLVCVGRRLQRAWIGEEAVVRATLEDAVEGFNEGSLRRVVRILDDGWRDRPSGIDRGTLGRGLLAFLQESRGPTGAMTHVLELVPDTLTVTLDPETDRRAEVLLRVRLFRVSPDGVRKLDWEARVEAEMGLRSGDWKMERSTHHTLAGGRPGF